jgi:hypothetical protein
MWRLLDHGQRANPVPAYTDRASTNILKAPGQREGRLTATRHYQDGGIQPLLRRLSRPAGLCHEWDSAHHKTSRNSSWSRSTRYHGLRLLCTASAMRPTSPPPRPGPRFQQPIYYLHRGGLGQVVLVALLRSCRSTLAETFLATYVTVARKRGLLRQENRSPHSMRLGFRSYGLPYNIPPRVV